VVAEISKLPPLVTSWEIGALQAQLAEAARGEAVPAPRRRLRREFRHCDSSTVRQQAQSPAANQPGAHPRQPQAPDPRRPHRRPIRQAPLGRFSRLATASPSPAIAATSSTAPISPSGPHSRSRAHAARLRTRRPHSQLPSAARQPRLCRSAPPRLLGLDWVKHSPMAEEYWRMARSIGESLQVHGDILGVHPASCTGSTTSPATRACTCLTNRRRTRRVPRQEGWFDLSTHFPWIGMRTADPAGAHVEYSAASAIPSASRSAPAMTPARAAPAHRDSPPARRARPAHAHSTVSERFDRRARSPAHRSRTLHPEKTVLWCCDPLHGNTRTTADGSRPAISRRSSASSTRPSTSTPPRQLLGGMHIELTGEDVTECVGGARGLLEADPQARLPLPARSPASTTSIPRNRPLRRPQDEPPRRLGSAAVRIRGLG